MGRGRGALVVALTLLAALVLAQAAEARRVATVRLPARFTRHELFAGPVLLGGAPVWAQRGADGRWRIYRMAGRRVKLRTLPRAGGGRVFHLVDLSASGGWLAVAEQANEILYPGIPGDDATVMRADRVLLGGLGRRFVQVAGCYGASCTSDPPCGTYADAGWDVSVGNGTVAWLPFCPFPIEVQARRAAGGPLLLSATLDPPFTPVFTMVVASGQFVAVLEYNQVVVWDLSGGQQSYKITPPPGQLVARVALQADGTIALATSTNSVAPDTPYQLAWATPSHPFLHPLPGSPVGQLRLVNNRILFAAGPQFGPRRALVLEHIPDGRRRVITSFGPSGTLANDGFAFDSSYALDAHHATWATQLPTPRHQPGSGPVIQLHVFPLGDAAPRPSVLDTKHSQVSRRHVPGVLVRAP
jgi:hypothetical protein